MIGLAIVLMALLIAGAIYYQRVQQQRRVQALRGILTDAMMQLEASNEYIARSSTATRASSSTSASTVHEEGLRNGS